MSDRALITETAAEVFADCCSPRMVIAAEGSWLPELWRTLDVTGFTGIGVTEDAGGGGGTLGDAAAVVSIAARFAAPVPLAETILARLTAAAAGLMPGSGPLTSAHGGSGVSVERGALGWEARGVLERVPWARVASHVILLEPRGRQILLVPIEQCSLRHGSNLAGEPRDEVTIDTVVDSAVVAAAPDDWTDRTWFTLGALLRTAQMAGALERIRDLTVSYVGQRVQFGRPIGSFQAVQHALAGLAGVATAVSVGVEAAAESAVGGDQNVAVAAAKAYASRVCGEATAAAHQLHGAMGVTREYELQLLTRRVWAWREEFGNEVHWAAELGGRVHAEGADGLWPLLADGGSA